MTRAGFGQLTAMYERLKEDARPGSRMSEIVLSGMSTRRYARVLPQWVSRDLA